MNFLTINLKEGSTVQFRLCMQKNHGRTVFACGDWYYTRA